MTPLPLETTNTVELVLDLICCFSRIEFDLVSPCVTSVLPVVAKVAPGIPIYQPSSQSDYCFPALFLVKSRGRIPRARARSSQENPDVAHLLLHDPRCIGANCK